ncbi:MAG: hypothetical protein U5R30_05975 [Deltaproteobacteria bacterium]|nr:hypothetical protein [Deltaproteobacteria bacterium]
MNTDLRGDAMSPGSRIRFWITPSAGAVKAASASFRSASASSASRALSFDRAAAMSSLRGPARARFNICTAAFS